jgi:HSP20 family protein
MFGLTPWTKEARPAGTMFPVEASPFRLMRRSLDELFDQFFGRWPLALEDRFAMPVWGLDMEETEKEVLVRAEAPGFEATDFDVRLVDNLLVIEAVHKIKKAEKKEAKEEVVARMKRSLTVPPGIDPEKIEAVYRNGVLEVHLPRKPEAVGRRIEVKT